MQNQKTSLESLSDTLAADMAMAEAELAMLIEEAAKSQPWYDPTTPETPEIIEMTDKIAFLEMHSKNAAIDYENTLEEIEWQKEQLLCFKKESDGRSCSSLSTDNLLPDIGLGSLYSLDEKFKSTALDLISLLVKITLQSIVFPLFFLWAMKSALIRIWKSKPELLEKQL